MAKLRRLFATLSLVLVVIGCATGLLITYRVGTTSLTRWNYRPTVPPPDLGAEEVSFHDRLGARVRGSFITGETGAGVVLLLHGIHSNRTSMIERARMLKNRGFGVLFIDLWAHGESEGDRVMFGYREAESVAAALRYLEERLPAERRGVVGQSLGGAALLLARERVALHAAVLELVYPEIYDATRNRIRMRSGELLSHPLSWLLLAQLPFRLGIWPSDLRPIDGIPRLGAPLFLIYGAEDRHTTAAESRRLFAAAVEPKEEWAIAKMPHFDPYLYARREYEQRVGAFFERTLRPAAAGAAVQPEPTGSVPIEIGATPLGG